MRARAFLIGKQGVSHVALPGVFIDTPKSLQLETWTFEDGKVLTLSRMLFPLKWCLNHKPKHSSDGPEFFVVDGENRKEFVGVYKPMFDDSEDLLEAMYPTKKGSMKTELFKYTDIDAVSLLESRLSEFHGKLVERHLLMPKESRDRLVIYNHDTLAKK